jgi:hypothetical protein
LIAMNFNRIFGKKEQRGALAKNSQEEDDDEDDEEYASD